MYLYALAVPVLTNNAKDGEAWHADLGLLTLQKGVDVDSGCQGFVMARGGVALVRESGCQGWG